MRLLVEGGETCGETLVTKLIYARGKHLVTADGETVRFPGVSAFPLLKRHILVDGWRVAVEPILDELRRIADAAGYHGIIALRVFRHGRDTNPFALDPWAYSPQQAADLTYKAARKDFIIDWTGGDYQFCFPGPPLDGPRGIHQHHNEFTAALVGLPYLWNVSNEPFKNGLDSFDAPPPPWVSAPWYSGWYDDNRDTSCVNLHTDRSEEAGAPKWVGKAHESAPYMWKHSLPVIYDEGMGANEVSIPNRRSNVPAYFRVYGSVLTMVNAVYLHSEVGLSCDGMGPDFAARFPVQRACFVEFFKGAAGALLP